MNINELELLCLSYYGKEAPPPPRIPMTREEEDELFTRFRKRKTAKACELIVRRYLCWSFSMASKFKGPRLDFDEAISVANTGLMEAIYGFDPALGFRFTTYAAWTVRRKLIEALISTYPVRVSDHVRKQWRELEETPEKLAAKMAGNDEPTTLAEFFERLGETSDVDITKLHTRDEDSAFVPAPSADPFEEAQSSDLSKQVREALQNLSALERTVVIARHYTEPAENFVSISRRLHVSKSSARDAYDQAVVKLRRHFTKDA